MEVQSIDINEYDILRRFAVMENYFKRCTGGDYKPASDYYAVFKEDSRVALEREAARMVDFVGLGVYPLHIKFADLPAQGGIINLSKHDSTDITIDDRCSTFPDLSLYILSHEICHKLMDVNRLWYVNSLAQEVEVYADLAPFYVGFGSLIMRGFCEKQGKVELRAGYLTPMTFARAYYIMTVINSHVKHDISSFPSKVRKIIKSAERSSVLGKLKDLQVDDCKELFEESSSSLATIKLYLDELSAFISEEKKSVAEIDKIISETFYPNVNNVKELDFHKMLMAFRYVQYTSNLQDFGEYGNLQRTLATLSAVLEMLHETRLTRGITMAALPIVPRCPICGKEIGKPLGSKIYHLVCPACHCHFSIDNRKDAVIKKMNVERRTRLTCERKLKKFSLGDVVHF